MSALCPDGRVARQRRRDGAWEPLPKDVRDTADAIIHFPPDTNVDEPPSGYPRLGASSGKAGAHPIEEVGRRLRVLGGNQRGGTVHK